MQALDELQQRATKRRALIEHDRPLLLDAPPAAARIKWQHRTELLPQREFQLAAVVVLMHSVLIHNRAECHWTNIGTQAIERLVRSFDPARVGSRHHKDLVCFLNGHAPSAVAIQPLHARVAHHVVKPRAQGFQKRDKERNLDLRLGLG